MFTSILVAYDGSAGSARALDLAVDLAGAVTGAHLVAAAVEEHLPHQGGATIGELEEEREFERRRCQRWLDDAVARAAEHGAALETELLAGHAAQELLRCAERLGSDLIVLGHSGHSRVWGRFLGSTAEKVSRHAHCSVLIAAPAEGRVQT